MITKLLIEEGKPFSIVAILVISVVLMIMVGTLSIIIHDENASNFYYSFSKGGNCTVYDESTSNMITCNGYPIGSKIYYPFTIFGLDTFGLLMILLVFFIPSLLFYIVFDDLFIAIIYLISPIPFTFAFGGYMAQFLVFILLMLIVRYREFFLIAIPLAIYIQRFAIWLIVMFSICVCNNIFMIIDIIKVKKYMFVITIILFVILLLTIRHIPDWSIYQPSYLSLMVFTLPMILLSGKLEVDESLYLLEFLILIVCIVFYFQPIVPITTPMSRMIITLDFVLLLGLVGKLKNWRLII